MKDKDEDGLWNDGEDDCVREWWKWLGETIGETMTKLTFCETVMKMTCEESLMKRLWDRWNLVYINDRETDEIGFAPMTVRLIKLVLHQYLWDWWSLFYTNVCETDEICFAPMTVRPMKLVLHQGLWDWWSLFYTNVCETDEIGFALSVRLMKLVFHQWLWDWWNWFFTNVCETDEIGFSPGPDGSPRRTWHGKSLLTSCSFRPCACSRAERATWNCYTPHFQYTESCCSRLGMFYSRGPSGLGSGWRGRFTCGTFTFAVLMSLRLKKVVRPRVVFLFFFFFFFFTSRFCCCCSSWFKQGWFK